MVGADGTGVGNNNINEKNSTADAMGGAGEDSAGNNNIDE